MQMSYQALWDIFFTSQSIICLENPLQTSAGRTRWNYQWVFAFYAGCDVIN